MEFFETLQYWHWLILGLILLGLEVLVVGAFFLWFGVAAIIVGIAALSFPALLWPGQILVWAILSVTTAAGWQIYSRQKKKMEPHSTMNRRGEQYVGRHFTLGKDIVNGVGELNVDDTRWKVVSHQDLSVGVKVKVIAVDGTSLRVEEFIS